MGYILCFLVGVLFGISMTLSAVCILMMSRNNQIITFGKNAKEQTAEQNVNEDEMKRREREKRSEAAFLDMMNYNTEAAYAMGGGMTDGEAK